MKIKRSISWILLCVLACVFVIGCNADTDGGNEKTNAVNNETPMSATPAKETPAAEKISYKVKVNVEFESNLVLSKYDVDFYVDGKVIDSIKHGKTASFELTLIESTHELSFTEKGKDEPKGTTSLDVKNNLEITYRIKAHNSKIDVDEVSKNVFPVNTGSPEEGAEQTVSQSIDTDASTEASSAIDTSSDEAAETENQTIETPTSSLETSVQASELTTSESSNENEMEYISGYQITKLPYTSNGLTITKFEDDLLFSDVTVRNDTGKPVASTSYIPYTCYNKDGSILSSSNIRVEYMNPGESCVASLFIPSDTEKIVFGKAKVVEAIAIAQVEVELETISGYQVNKLPYNAQGLVITNIDFTSYMPKVTVRNETGGAIASMTSISYKCYDSEGKVLESSSMYLSDVNNGGTCVSSLILPSGTSKIIFGKATIYAGKATEEKETELISGYLVNKLPYKVDGLTITKIEFDMFSAYVTVKNETGHAIGSLSSISYNCYDGDGNNLSSGSMFLEDMNDGATCIASVFFTSSTKKIIFGEADIYKGKESQDKEVEMANISGYQVNKLPYSTNGLTITNIEFGSWDSTVTIRNDTGKAISALSHIEYKCYDANGSITSSSDQYVHDMNPGETCLVSLYVPTGTVKIVFDEADISNGQVFESKELQSISGYQVNKLPYTVSGLTIEKIEFDMVSVKATVKNETGKKVDSISSIAYKCYNDKGYVVDSGNMYLEDMQPGETCVGNVLLLSGATKIVFDSCKIR